LNLERNKVEIYLFIQLFLVLKFLKAVLLYNNKYINIYYNKYNKYKINIEYTVQSLKQN